MIIHQPWNSRKNYTYNAYVYTETSYASHFHSNYELIYVLSGKMPLTVNGAELLLEEGEAILLSPFAVHSFTISDTARAWVGVFSDDFVSAFAGKHGRMQYSKFRLSPENEILLKERFFYQGQPERYLCMAFLYVACSDCIRFAQPLNAETDREFISRVTAYISEHLNDDIRMKELATHLNYEYHYFSALFHKCFFMDFKKFLNIFRIERACALLAQESGDVTSVFRQCGFSGIRNFNRVFKQITGVTPTEYRLNRGI
jgi:AraC-like DNA-binding protein